MAEWQWLLLHSLYSLQWTVLCSVCFYWYRPSYTSVILTPVTDLPGWTHLRSAQRATTLFCAPLGSNSTWLDSTRHIRRVEPMHFGCVELVEQHSSTRSTRSSRLARLARQSRTCRVESSRAKWNLSLTTYQLQSLFVCCNHSCSLELSQFPAVSTFRQHLKTELCHQSDAHF